MKKIICLVIAIMSFLTATCYAGTTFKDVENTKYEDAVDKLVTFEIVNGFDENTFKPKESVTRAQLSKMLVVSMGRQGEVEAAKKKFLSFSDVLSSHWGYGYIKVASDNKLVNGYENGTFKPDATVTYAEATTMIVRALGYEDEIKKSELAWPNNYMSYADEKLKLFETLGEFKATEPATRGDVAILIWNALRTGVCEIVAENSKGLVYGQGTPMITEYLNYVYIQDAEVTDVEFDNDYKKAVVTLKEEDKKAQEIKFGAEDAIEMYGKKVSVLYDKSSKKVLDLEYETEYKIVNAEVTNISKTKIYVSNRSTGYNVPDNDNILLYGIEDIDEAVEVILLLEGNTVKYCVAMGASEAIPGLVVDDYMEIDDDEYGVQIRKIGQNKGGETYYLANDDEWPDYKDVVLYYINSDDLLVILEEIDSEYAVEVSAIESDYIKTAAKDYYEFEDEDEYSVILTSSSNLKYGELDDININMDLVYITTYNAHVYIFVFEDAIENSLDEELVDALYDLEDIIEDALEYDEEEYTQESYANLMYEVNYGLKLNYKTSLNKIKNTILDIEEAIEDLDDDVSRSEKKVTKAKKELREFVNDDCADIIDDERYYTEDSFEYFYECYEDAVEVLEMSDALLTEVNDAYDYLIEAIDELEDA